MGVVVRALVEVWGMMERVMAGFRGVVEGERKSPRGPDAVEKDQGNARRWA
jgi:hypothetical protein